MDLRELQILAAVGDAGGFNKAAERLLITQSAVSQAIGRMERRLGTALLARETPPRPTPAGERVLRFAARMLEAHQDLERDLADLSRPVRGRLRLGASQTIAESRLGPMMHAFHKANPHYSIDVATLPSRELVLRVREGDLELGFGPFQEQMPSLAREAQFDQVLRLFAASSSPVFAALRKGDEDALKQTILLTSFLDPVENRPRSTRLRYRFGGVWKITSLNLRIQLIHAGIGVGFLQDESVTKSPLGKRLRHLDKFEYGTVQRTTGLYWSKEKNLSPAARDFVAFCGKPGNDANG